MRKFAAFSIASVLLVSAVAFASDLKTGDKVGAYYVHDVTGPSAGEDLCYRCKFGSAPVVNIFIKNMEPNAVTLIKKLDAQMKEKQRVERLCHRSFQRR